MDQVEQGTPYYAYVFGYLLVNFRCIHGQLLFGTRYNLNRHQHVASDIARDGKKLNLRIPNRISEIPARISLIFYSTLGTFSRLNNILYPILTYL